MQCKAKTKIGKRCKNQAITGSNYCQKHLATKKSITKSQKSQKSQKSKKSKTFPGAKWFQGGTSLVDLSKMDYNVNTNVNSNRSTQKSLTTFLPKENIPKEYIPKDIPKEYFIDEDEYEFYHNLVHFPRNKDENSDTFLVYMPEEKGDKYILKNTVKTQKLQNVLFRYNALNDNLQPIFLLQLIFSMYIFCTRFEHEHDFTFDLDPEGAIACHQILKETKKFGLFQMENVTYQFYVVAKSTRITTDESNMNNMWRSFVRKLKNGIREEWRYSLDEIQDIVYFSALLQEYQTRDGNINELADDLFPLDHLHTVAKEELCNIFSKKEYRSWLNAIPKEKRGMLVDYTRCIHNSTFFDINPMQLHEFTDYVSSYQVTLDFMFSFLTHFAYFLWGSFIHHLKIRPVWNKIYLSSMQEEQEVQLEAGEFQKTFRTSYRFFVLEMEESEQEIYDQFNTMQNILAEQQNEQKFAAANLKTMRLATFLDVDFTLTKFEKELK